MAPEAARARCHRQTAATVALNLFLRPQLAMAPAESNHLRQRMVDMADPALNRSQRYPRQMVDTAPAEANQLRQ